MERMNARALTPGMLAERGAGGDPPPDMATIDVSFISLAKLLESVLGCLAAGHDVLALVKPQFELGRGRVGKGGVVREADDRREALIAVGEAALALGEVVLGYYSSGLPGPKGNLETFVWLAGPSSGRAGAAATAGELERMAREVEP
jgi:23S rRNA (cytidine1920-2'-O)/16S rRNA (cytidine1409-2'-O)-methyltransferase